VRGRAARKGCSEGLARCCKSLFVLVVVLGSFFRALARARPPAAHAPPVSTLGDLRQCQNLVVVLGSFFRALARARTPRLCMRPQCSPLVTCDSATAKARPFACRPARSGAQAQPHCLSMSCMPCCCLTADRAAAATYTIDALGIHALHCPGQRSAAAVKPV